MTTAIGITNHARQMWVKGVIRDRHDIMAVQTLRNQLMAATFFGVYSDSYQSWVVQRNFSTGYI